MKKLVKLSKNKNAVSEVLGTVLLLGISVALFSAVYVSFFSVDVEEPSPSVDMVAYISDTTLYLDHRGGDSIGVNAEIILSDEDDNSRVLTAEPYINQVKNNDKWNIGERAQFDLEDLSVGFNFDFDRWENLTVHVRDKDTKSTILLGNVRESRVSDLNLEVFKKKISSSNSWWITSKITNLGPSDTKDVFVKISLPDGLVFNTLNSVDGSYDANTGIWSIDSTISALQSRELNITVDISSAASPAAQLAIVLDGTTNQSHKSDFTDILNGLHDALMDGTIPHNGEVKLTLIQYYGKHIVNPDAGEADYSGTARVEKLYRTYDSVVVRDDNYDDIAFNITKIKGEGKGADWAVPLSSGIKLAYETLDQEVVSYYSAPIKRQLIVVIASSRPDCYVPLPANDADAGVRAIKPSAAAAIPYLYHIGRADALVKRDDMLDILKMHERFGFTSAQDEIDVAIINEMWQDNWRWSLYHLAFPQQGYENPGDKAPQGPGWVLNITNKMDITESVKDMFRPIFQIRRDIPVEIINSKYLDQNPQDNSLIITVSALDET